MFKHFRIILRITPRDIVNFFKAAGRFFRDREFVLLLCVAVFINSFAVTSFAVTPILSVIAGYVVDELKEWAIDQVKTNSDPNVIFENKMRYIAVLREFAQRHNMDYDTALQWLAHCCADWDSSLIDVYGDNAAEMYNIMHEPVYQLCNNYIYQCDIATLASLITDPNASAPSVDDNGNVQVPADKFNDYIETNNYKYYPKNTTDRISYRTDSFYSTHYFNGADFAVVPFYTLENVFGNKGAGYQREIWFLPFYTDGTNYYYDKYQLHVWLEPGTDSSGKNCTYVKCESFNMIEDKASFVDQTLYTLYDPVYLFVTCGSKCWFYQSKTLEDYLKRTITDSKGYGLSSSYYSADDITKTTPVSAGHFFTKKYADHDSTCAHGSADDLGYIINSTKIELNFNIDIDKVPNNYYITINGDTIYDYSITNPETGASDTINNYITNNYILPEPVNSEPSDGGVGGNVTVGGQIDVGGKVDVDVNVNINGGGNGNGNIYDMPDTAFVDDETPINFV